MDTDNQLRAGEATRRGEGRTLLERIVPLAFLEILREPVAVVLRGDVAFVNRALVQHLGYASAKEVEGRPLLDLIHPGDRAVTIERMHTSTTSGAANTPLERRLLRRDGSVVEVEAASTPILSSQGTALVVVMRDLSQRRAVVGRLAAADRMGSLAHLAAGIAHEINNPMSYLVTNVEFAHEELDRLRKALVSQAPVLERQPEALPLVQSLPRLADAAEALEDALGGAERVRQIVKNLKTLSRDNSQKKQLIDLRTVVESALEVVANEIRHRARLVRELPEVPTVEANASQLTQVFVNLLTNAAQAIEKGTVQDNEVRVATGLDSAGRPFVEIRDTGVGISAEVRERMFDLFFTTKPIGVGQGLGLTVSHALVTSLNGEIAVEANQPRGAVFRVTLPPAAAVAPAAPAARETPRSPRILVVDDEAAIGAALGRILGKGYEVTALTRAREALARIEGGERFDIILCDLMMPELTGMELYEHLKSLAPDQATRMIFVTGGAFTPKARAFLETTRNLRVDKPFNKDALRALVAERLGRGGA